MNEYEIGRDIEALRCRLDQLESTGGGRAHAKVEHAGLTGMHAVRAGVAPHQEPVLWKPDHAMRLPPFLRQYVHGSDRGLQFDIQPESKSWTCNPEPLVLFVNWFSGGTDPFYQFQDQLFSVVRITEPNSGHISCSATYQARRVALGKAKSHYFPPTGSPGYAANSDGFHSFSQFRITLRGPGGTNIGGFTSPAYTIFDCHEAFAIDYSWDINAGLYDLVTGATWEVTGVQTVDRC